MLQAVVDAVAELLHAGAFDEAATRVHDGSDSSADSRGADSGGHGAEAWALDFLAAFLGDGRATAAPGTVMQVHEPSASAA